jgi:hypothetical protein
VAWAVVWYETAGATWYSLRLFAVLIGDTLGRPVSVLFLRAACIVAGDSSLRRFLGPVMPLLPGLGKAGVGRVPAGVLPPLEPATIEGASRRGVHNGVKNRRSGESLECMTGSGVDGSRHLLLLH